MFLGLTHLSNPTAMLGDAAPWPELDWLRANQDIVWFTALIGWSFALVLWRWSSPHSREMTWLPWAAGAGVTSAAIQFGLYNPPFGFFFARLVPGTASTYAPALIAPNLAGELALVATTAVMLTAWGWRMLGGRRGLALRWFTPIPLLAILALHPPHPLVGGSTLAISAVFIALLLIRQSRTEISASWAIGAIGLAPVFSTYGPLAVATDSLQRSGPPTCVGLFAALWQAGAAMLAILALVRPSQESDRPSEPLWRATEARPYLLAALIGCAVGLAFSLRTAADQREELLQNRLRRAASAAKTIDPALLAPLVSAEFQLVLPAPNSALPLPASAFVGGLANGRSDALVRELARIVRATPFLSVARIVVLRDGWLVAAASNQPPGPSGTVELLRAATPQDQANAAAGASHVEAAPVPEFDRHFYCRGALTGADGRLLGWLEFTQTESYMSSLRRFRAAPLLITALGLTLIAGAFVQRRQARTREAALRAAAVSAEANRVKTNFFAKVSHELRTPLQGLLGYSELLASEITSAAGRTRLAALRQHGELMLRLVNDLLDLNAIEAGAFRHVSQPTALADLIRQSVESFRPRASARNLSLHFSSTPDVPTWLATDAGRWRQIVFNLVGNAVKFTERGGVEIALSVLARDGESCTVELAVRDTGPGIAPADHAKIFQPFSRLDLTAQHEGSGLGLALTEALCRSAGGSLLLESDGRSGACFRARLPVRVTSSPPPLAQLSAATLTGQRVLIADDNTLVRELFAAHLTRLGATCDVAIDGEQTLTRALAGNYTALVLDLAMPRLDGGEVARRLRAQLGRPLRIVGVSAHASATDRALALAAGMDDFLVKPVELAALGAALALQPGPSPTAAALLALESQLKQLFRAEAFAQHRATSEALTHRDWTALKSRAHYLKNSAAVVHDERLYAACGALEDAADAQNLSAAKIAWATCADALAPWLG